MFFGLCPCLVKDQRRPFFWAIQHFDPHRDRFWLTSRSPLRAGIELPAKGIRHLPGDISQTLRRFGFVWDFGPGL
jgi:hypothetical protein